MTPHQLKNAERHQRRNSLHAPMRCAECRKELLKGDIYYASSAGYECCEKCMKMYNDTGSSLKEENQ